MVWFVDKDVVKMGLCCVFLRCSFCLKTFVTAGFLLKWVILGFLLRRVILPPICAPCPIVFYPNPLVYVRRNSRLKCLGSYCFNNKSSSLNLLTKLFQKRLSFITR